MVSALPPRPAVVGKVPKRLITIEQVNLQNIRFQSTIEMTIPWCAKRSEWEEGLVMRALHIRNGVMDISRFLDQSNDLNLAPGSSLRFDWARIKISREDRHSKIGLPQHITIDVTLAAMYACATSDEGIDRYLSRSMVGHRIYGHQENSPDISSSCDGDGDLS
jgi:hypothetical protein